MMTRDEVVDLLTLIASRDRRKVGHADVTAWHQDVGDLSFADAAEAVSRYFRESREWITPYDVRTRVKAIRTERLASSVIPAPPPELADDPRAYQAALQARIRDAADGHGEAVPPAIGGPDLSQRAGHSSSLRGAVAGLKAKLGPPLPPRGIESPRQIAARQAEAHRLEQEPDEPREAS